jgi:AcrR family transcriptional regulator
MTDTTPTKERMIAAAADLFAQSGLNGVTTKDIAHSARVSEGNIFRYFPSKRDLFVAAVDSELGKLSLRAEVLDQIASPEDSRAALRALFELITETVVKQPSLVRLLHYSALEFGPDIEPVYRKHLDAVLTATAKNFEKWSNNYGFCNLNSHVTVLSFVATVVLLQNYPVFTGSDLPFSSVETAAAAYAELWYRVLSGAPVNVRPNPDVHSADKQEAQPDESLRTDEAEIAREAGGLTNSHCRHS